MKKLSDKKGLRFTLYAIVIIIAVSLAAYSIVILTKNIESIIANNENAEDSQGIIVSKYDYSAEDELVDEIIVDKKKDADFLRKIIETAVYEETNASIQAEVIINYNNGTTLFVDLSNNNHAYLEKENEEGKTIKISEEVLKFLNEKLK